MSSSAYWARVARARRASAAPAHVGLGLHSINEIEEEIAGLHTEMLQFGDELSRALFGDDPHNRAFDLPLPSTPQDKIDLYHHVWRPLMNDWLEFREAHGHSFWQNLPLSGAWDRTQDFRARLIKTRERAREKKFDLMTIDPTPPKHDLDLGDTAKKVVEVAAYVGIGIAGLFLLSRVGRVSQMRRYEG